jgi:hypothetical protein
MSSRELLEFIDFLPDESAYRTARRGGDWSDKEYREARLVNETALARSDNSGYMPELLLSPLQQHLEDQLVEYRVKKHDSNLAQLQGKNRKAVTDGH